MKRRYRFSLQWKLVFFTTAVAIITYSTSAFFIYILYDYVKDYINMSHQWFTIITLLLGIIWTGYFDIRVRHHYRAPVATA